MKRRLVLAAVAGAFFHAGVSGSSEFAGGLDLTGQSIRGDTASSKFEEYEDVPRGFYVERACVDLSSGASLLCGTRGTSGPFPCWSASSDS